MLPACALKRPQYETPEVTLPAKFRNSATVAEDPSRSVSPLRNSLSEWWRLLNNSELNELVDRALANNSDLRIATNRIAQAYSRTRQAAADRLPSVSLPASANIAAPSEGIGLRADDAPLTSKRTYQVNVRADWRPDLWGEVKSMYESSELQLWRAIYARDDVQRALVANVVSVYSNYLSLCDRLRIAEESESVLSGLLASVRERMDAGDATIIDFQQQRAAVFQVRATIPQLVQQRDQAKNRLASLLGTVPGALHLSERGLQTLSYPVVSPGLPSALLLRRPDVRVMEATMLAADANIDAARARIFPQMDINAQYGVGGFSFSQLLSPAGIFWSGLANLSTVIFDYGKRSADVAIARRLHEELVESYIQTLYNAVREVEDAQVGIASTENRLRSQQVSVDAASQAWTYSRESYEAGAIDYMVLLDTERNYHARLDELNRIQLEHVLALVELFQSIGGGVDTTASIADKRLAPPEVNVGLVQSVQPFESPGTLFSAAKLPDSNGRQWMVELPGLVNYTSVMAARRDLYARFPDLMTRDRVVLVRQEGGAADEKYRDRTSWYRLFVGGFADAAATARFCAVIKSQFMRCNPVQDVATASDSQGKWLQMTDVPPGASQQARSQFAPARSHMLPAVPVTPLPHEATTPSEPVLPDARQPQRIPVKGTLPPGPTQMRPDKPADALVAGPKHAQPADNVSNAKWPQLRLSRELAAYKSLPAPRIRETATVVAAAPRPENEGRPAYAVQVYSLEYAGRFTPEVVEALKKRFERSMLAWKQKGYAPYLYMTSTADSNAVVSICIGQFALAEDAARLVDSITAREQAAAHVIPVALQQDGHTLPIEAQWKMTAEQMEAAPANKDNGAVLKLASMMSAR